MTRARLGIRLGALACVLVSGIAWVGQHSEAAATVSNTSAFTAITPQRLVDTRIGLGAPLRQLQATESIDVQVTGRLGVPDSATAVVANVTAVGASGPGFLQVLPTGRAAFGSSSTLNVDLVGQTIPNATFAPIGDGGRLTVYAIFTTDVVIDIFGYFTPATTSTSGRLVPLSPQRILDTRVSLGWTPPAPPSAPTPPPPTDSRNCGDFGSDQQAAAGFDTYSPNSDDDEIPCETLPADPDLVRARSVAAASVITLQVAGRGGVPASGVSAVVLNVTAVDPFGPGFVQVAPTPVVAGASSNLNTAAGRTTANLVVVPLGPAGTVDLYVTTPADLLADVVGYFTNGSAPASSVGLFVPITPSRQLDSRTAAASPLPAGTVTTIDINDISGDAIAIAGNLTATEPTHVGYLQIAAPPMSLGASSNLNVAYIGQTVANAIISPTTDGLAQIFNQNPTHELLDVTGWFTSAVASDPPVPATQPPATQPPTTQPPTTTAPTQPPTTTTPPTTTPPTTAPPITPVPVLQYSFDNDAAGVTVADSSPNRLNGTLVNTTTSAASTSSVAGRGKAITLVGASHQYIAVPEANALDVNAFTVAALVRYTGVQNDTTDGRWEVLEKADAYWINIRTDGHVRVGGFFGSCTSASWKYLDSTTTVPTNTWTHVAATYNGTTLTVWINGKEAGSQAVTGRTCNNNHPLAIGAKNYPAQGLLEAFWDGQLDDIRIYNRALTAAEMGALVPG